MEFTELFEKINEDRSHWKTEAEVRSSWLHHLQNQLGIRFMMEQERNDATHNQIIIEFKNSGLFSGSASSPKFKEAVYERLKPYIIRRAANEGLDVSEYTGIATDGDHVVFCYMRGEEIYPNELLEFNAVSISKIALALQQETRRALTTDNLITDFGHNAVAGRTLMQALANELVKSLGSSVHTKIKMLFEEWRTLFGQAADLSTAQTLHIHNTLRFSIPDTNEDRIPIILFVIHTYNSLVMKLLGAEIVSQYNEDLTQHQFFCENLAAQDDEAILATLQRDIEKSTLFDAVGIRGFVAEAIFTWYLDTSQENLTDLFNGLRSVLLQLSLYRMDTLTAARSKDVLKGFYQSLVPDTLRKSLGEFYTPDWLVDVTVDKAEVADWLSIRTLDPTCGSGSFIIEIITRKRLEAEKQGLTSEETLDHILDSAWGFDLNPLAVQAARVNFLIAISDLFSQCPGKRIEIPVLLADSVYFPSKDKEGKDDNITYRIGSQQADLLISLPPQLAFDRDRLDIVFMFMEEAIEAERSFESVLTRLAKRGLFTKQELATWREPLNNTFSRVHGLHQRNWNGIWFQIIRNFFWSTATEQFDLVIGNPPWVRWSSLPNEYREKIKSTCESYDIFSDTPYHGGNELDISGILTYSVADKWLKKNGKLVFLITQTHFQSPSSQGFRSFMIDEVTGIQPRNVDDLKNLKPFPDAANKTVIAVFQKTEAVSETYPVPYRIWNNKEGFPKKLPERLSKEDILKRVDILKHEAYPVDALRSPWIIMPEGQIGRVSALRGVSEWIQGRKGITTDLNGIYMVHILDEDPIRKRVLIETRPDAGRNTKHLAPKRYWIESELLYPLIKGAADFSTCFVEPKDELYVFVPNRGITKKHLQLAEESIEDDLDETRRYFYDHKTLLSARSTYKLRLSKYPFYVIYNVGLYTFSPYKVVWAEQSSQFKAAVVTGKKMPVNDYRVYIPDHKVYFVDFEEKESAYYLCGLLAAPMIRNFIQSHTISIQVGNIFKHMDLPIFQKDNQLHNQLVDRTEQAHSELDQQIRSELIQQIGEIAEKIIGT